MSKKYLAAIHFGDNHDVDALLEQFVSAQIANGIHVSGVLQSRGAAGGDCHCADMDLIAIGTGRVFRISQPLGSGSSGCRLHPGALAECSAFLSGQITGKCDLLVLNRFGRGESEGRGFRDLISLAFTNDVPVLIAVRNTYLEAWQQFAGDYGITLPFDLSVVDNWFTDLGRADAA